jgi:2-iminobutanoate/2-iminopropanoate deaminase
MRSVQNSGSTFLRRCIIDKKHRVLVKAMSGTQGKIVIQTDKAPAALGPYSQAIKAGNTVYVSGQIGIVPGTKDFASPEVEGQTEQVLKNMGAILEAAGANYSNVVK